MFHLNYLAVTVLLGLCRIQPVETTEELVTKEHVQLSLCGILCRI